MKDTKLKSSRSFRNVPKIRTALNTFNRKQLRTIGNVIGDGIPQEFSTQGVSTAETSALQPCGDSGFPAPNIPHSAGIRPHN